VRALRAAHRDKLDQDMGAGSKIRFEGPLATRPILYEASSTRSSPARQSSPPRAQFSTGALPKDLAYARAVREKKASPGRSLSPQAVEAVKRAPSPSHGRSSPPRVRFESAAGPGSSAPRQQLSALDEIMLAAKEVGENEARRAKERATAEERDETRRKQEAHRVSATRSRSSGAQSENGSPAGQGVEAHRGLHHRASTITGKVTSLLRRGADN